MNEEFIGLNGEEGVDGCARVRAHECVDHMCVSPWVNVNVCVFGAEEKRKNKRDQSISGVDAWLYGSVSL